MANHEDRQFPAKYEPGREKNGHFAKGNKLSVGVKSGPTILKKLNTLRELWYDATSVDDMLEVKAELMKIIKTCPEWDVKLKAIVYYTDRQLGKPTEHVQVSQESTSTSLNLNLSPEQAATLTEAARILSGETIDVPALAEASVTPLSFQVEAVEVEA
ncbi:hypothetical protein [Fimbriiglobus ruber]|uniref:Uncharacterized protein n=1 Tax=Fimbriiglobus ruber TaxID=1908690 RepID=A0A225EDX9_9BACT|nr:hypothetical protein [Fimbriiglobus ruber]OWK46605.1 hypothetical protein FRUB_00304 [Fimbriiglobus ruber]